MSYLPRLFLAAAVLSGGSVSAQAVANNGSITLTGAMETVCYLEIDQTYTDSIDLLKGTTGSFAIATVSEKCNMGNGFTVTVQSANGGSLVDASGNKVPYTVRYDNSGDQSLQTPVTLTRNNHRASGTTRNFNVKVPAKPDAVAGSYADTITVSIAAR